MRFVKADWNAGLSGFHTDARAYLSKLPELRDQLPAGAWEFASDPEHYDMRGPHCVKDLELAGIEVTPDRSGRLRLDFAPSEWKHEAGLAITYTGVRHFSIERRYELDWLRADAVLLDEILPDPAGGCVHEIALTDASITVRGEDLRAVWAPPAPGRTGPTGGAFR